MIIQKPYSQVQAASIRTTSERLIDTGIVPENDKEIVGIIRPELFFNFFEAGTDFFTHPLDLLSQSPTAKQCMKTRQDFTYDGGITFGDTVVNHHTGETLGDLFRTLVDYACVYETLAAEVNFDEYDAIEEKFNSAFVKAVNPSYIRVGAKNAKDEGYIPVRTKIVENKYFGKYKKHLSYFQPYYTKSVERLRPKCYATKQMFYAHIQGLNDEYYAYPHWYSAYQAMSIEIEALNYISRDLKTGMKTDTFLSFKQNPNFPVETGRDKNGKPITTPLRDLVNDQIEMMTNTDTPRVVALFGNREAPEISQVESKATQGILVDIDETITSKIAQAFDVFPALANIEEAGKLGSGRELMEKVMIQRKRLENVRAFVLRSIKQIVRMTPLANVIDPDKLEVIPDNIINVLPDWAIDSMSREEIRKFLREEHGLDLEDEPTQVAGTELQQTDTINKADFDFVNQVEPEELNEVFAKYKEAVNMSYSELRAWSQTNCSRMAGVDRSPIERNLRLLSKNKDQWGAWEIKAANKTIAFIARMKENLGGENIVTDKNGRECGTKAEISLKNWAFDPKK